MPAYGYYFQSMLQQSSQVAVVDHPLLSALVLTLAVAALAAAFMLYLLLIRRAVQAVIDIFRQHDALAEGNARTAGELGLAPYSYLDLFRPALRDYKPQVLRSLIDHDIVRVTPDNRLYLCEEKLRAMMARPLPDRQ